MRAMSSSSKNKRKTSLSERLADLTSAAPSTSFDPDAPDFEDGTMAGLSRYHDEEEEDVPMSRPSADLRVAADMESIGQEYGGKRISRKALATTSALAVGDAPDPEASSSENDSMRDDGEGVRDKSGAAIASLNLDDISSSEDEGEDEDEDGDRAEQQEYEDAGDFVAKQASVFAGVRAARGVDAMVEEQIMQLDKQDEKARKGRGVAGQGELKRAREALRQRQWWDRLLEVRILLQRLMNAANRLPGPSELPLYLEGDDTLTKIADEGASAAQELAVQLSLTRRAHMGCWGIDDGDTDDDDTRRDSGDTTKDIGEGGDIASAVTQEEEAVSKREHMQCMSWWEKVHGRWHNRTQLVDPSLQRKFKVVNQGPWAQVTASLGDRERANRRAFMTESECHDYLGRNLAKRLKAKSSAGEESEQLNRRSGAGDAETVEVLGRERRRDSEALDLEVIDDRDLYQHLLKEFMDTSGGGGGGYGTAASVPLRRKSRKKAVDRRASKGRKIKYVTHPKMQNFMFPQEYDAPPMEPSELFSSLFGGAAAQQ